MANKPIIAANWKMNGTVESARQLASAVNPSDKCEVVLYPPFPLINEVVQAANPTIHIGGQDCHTEESGAYTGDVSAVMLKDIGCSYVITGHSERRQYHSETDELICRKSAAAHSAGLKAIICVGESLEQREAGDAIEVVKKQIRSSVPEAADYSNTIIAYEPVWAIGTGKTPTTDEIVEIHVAIISCTSGQFPVLYGGSVKGENAVEILALDGVGGVLVGGASLKADSFNQIIGAV